MKAKKLKEKEQDLYYIMSHLGKRSQKMSKLHLSAVDHIFVLFLQKEMKPSITRGINSTKSLYMVQLPEQIYEMITKMSGVLFLVKAYNKLVE